MNYILFDGPNRDALLPFTYTRPVADIRVGILTIREKWELFLGATTTTVTEDYLSDKFPMVEMEHNIMINASYIPTEVLVHQIKNLKENQAIFEFPHRFLEYFLAVHSDCILCYVECAEPNVLREHHRHCASTIVAYRVTVDEEFLQSVVGFQTSTKRSRSKWANLVVVETKLRERPILV